MLGDVLIVNRRFAGSGVFIVQPYFNPSCISAYTTKPDTMADNKEKEPPKLGGSFFYLLAGDSAFFVRISIAC